MADVAVPVLGFLGWRDDPAKKLDILLAHTLVADYSQSNRWEGTVTSLAYLIAKYGRDAYLMRTESEKAYERYLSNYFSKVEVTVTTKVSDEKTDKYELVITVEVWVNGVKYDMAKAFDVIESTFKEIAGVNNNG